MALHPGAEIVEVASEPIRAADPDPRLGAFHA